MKPGPQVSVNLGGSEVLLQVVSKASPDAWRFPRQLETWVTWERQLLLVAVLSAIP